MLGAPPLCRTASLGNKKAWSLTRWSDFFVESLVWPFAAGANGPPVPVGTEAGALISDREYRGRSTRLLSKRVPGSDYFKMQMTASWAVSIPGIADNRNLVSFHHIIADGDNIFLIVRVFGFSAVRMFQ